MSKFVCFNDNGDTLRRSGELCLSNMARIRVVGRGGARRIKVDKQLHFVEQVAYDDIVVDEVDPNVELVAKLRKRLKFFRDIAGDSDGVSNKFMFCIRFRALQSRYGYNQPVVGIWKRGSTIRCKITV